MTSARNFIIGSSIFIGSIFTSFLLAWFGGGYIGDNLIGGNKFIIQPQGDLTNNVWWDIVEENTAPSFMMLIFNVIIYGLPIFGFWMFLQYVFARQALDVLESDIAASEGYSRFRRGG